MPGNRILLTPIWNKSACCLAEFGWRCRLQSANKWFLTLNNTSHKYVTMPTPTTFFITQHLPSTWHKLQKILPGTRILTAFPYNFKLVVMLVHKHRKNLSCTETRRTHGHQLRSTHQNTRHTRFTSTLIGTLMKYSSPNVGLLARQKATYTYSNFRQHKQSTQSNYHRLLNIHKVHLATFTSTWHKTLPSTRPPPSSEACCMQVPSASLNLS